MITEYDKIDGNLVATDYLEHFTMPKCNVCGSIATFDDEDNGACGDPECCGSYESWKVLVCPKCGIRESIR